MIPRKQRSTQADWTDALAAAYAEPDYARADALIEQAADEVRRKLPLVGRRPAYGWSGGKDSLALAEVMSAAGVENCVLVISGLEWPAFLGWVTDNMPWNLHVECRSQIDLRWLADHPEMLFPTEAGTASRWFALVQHAGQRHYCKRFGVDVLLMGRRRADGNHVGRGGLYRDRGGFVRWSPIADWSHEDVLTVLGSRQIELPPCYGWPRGFRVGTGPWPARQWTENQAHGWAEVAAIDPSVLELAAAADLPGAKEALCAA